jgi:uncharacterized protein (TIGR02611 family)
MGPGTYDDSVSLAPDEVDAGPESRDWAWRRRVRADPRLYPIYRILVAVVGSLVTVIGIIAIPAPGPGWALVFLGLAILASEFSWAKRLLAFARRHVGGWTSWAGRQAWPVRALLGLLTLAFLVAIFWVYFRLAGVPGFVPDAWVPSWTGLHP